MKFKNCFPTTFISITSKVLILSVLMLCVLIGWSPNVHANTAAGTTITNSVSVSFDDAGGTAQTAVTDSVTVTVNLVGGVAWGVVPADGSASSGGALPAAYTINLINTGNGSDTFTVSQLTSESSGNLSAGAWSVTSPITLFGTVSSGAGVPSGGDTIIPVGNLTVADLTAGTTQVLINGTPYTVAAGSSATQLVVSGDATGDVGGAGVQIGEVAAITFDGTAGTLSGSLSETHTHSVTATGTLVPESGLPAPTATSGTWVTTVSGAALTVNKYVRNATNANGNTGGTGSTSVNTQTYYDGGVTGNPGDELEYAIVITNTANGLATNVIFTDTLSTYTTYIGSSAKVDIDGDGTWEADILAGTETEAIDATPGIIVVSGSNITVYPGTGGNESTGQGGQIAGGGTAYSVVLYRVTIN